MKVAEIADEVQTQLLHVLEIAHENVTAAVESIAEQAQHVIPHQALRIAERLPAAAPAVDRAFGRAERVLATQRKFAVGVAEALRPNAETASAATV